jgi:hypothetical protein
MRTAFAFVLCVTALCFCCSAAHAQMHLATQAMQYTAAANKTGSAEYTEK